MLALIILDLIGNNAEIISNIKPNAETEDTNDAINILLVGATGVGKSYLSNALMGCENPENCPHFAAVSGSVSSVTYDIGKYSGTIYNGTYGGMESKITIFDTPGYASTNPDDIYKNQVLIANQIGAKINAVVLVIANRFEETAVGVLESMNRWSHGQVWNNIIILQTKVIFDNDAAHYACEDHDNLVTHNMNMDYIRDKILKRAYQGNWEVSEIDPSSLEVTKKRPFSESDMDQLAGFVVNPSQVGWPHQNIIIYMIHKMAIKYGSSAMGIP